MLEHCRAIDRIIGKYFPDVTYSGILHKHVKDLPLLMRTRNCLANGNIQTVKELVRKREEDLKRLTNFGKKSLTDVKERVAELGLSLGMTEEDLEEIRHDVES